MSPASAAPRLLEPPSADLALAPGVPDLASFPHAAWARCLGARARSLRVHDLGYGAGAGLPELQAAILDHIAVSRGVTATPDQVLIVPSTRVAIEALARLALRGERRDGNIVWMEEPGWSSVHELFQNVGARLVPVRCDTAGLDVAQAPGPRPRLIYTTPSHQYPTGATMSLPRRLALLERARDGGAIVLEDDYDSDFQYAARPIAALQGIDRSGIVVYVGTFSKILAPGLRVAYAVVPPGLAAEMNAAMRLKGAVVSIHVQAALADFIREGRLRTHLRRMNIVYAARMAATVDALRRHCGHILRISDGEGGLQLATWFLDPAVDDRAIVASLRAQGFAMQAMSRFYLGAPKPGLLFGIARVDPADIDGVAQRLGALLDRLTSAR